MDSGWRGVSWLSPAETWGQRLLEPTRCSPCGQPRVDLPGLATSWVYVGVPGTPSSGLISLLEQLRELREH